MACAPGDAVCERCLDRYEPNETLEAAALLDGLRRGCGAADPVLACDDGGEGTQSRIDVELQPVDYALLVDGFAANSSGTTTVQLSLTPL